MEKIFSKTSRYSTESVQTENLGIASPVPMGSWNKAIMYQKLNYVRHNQATYLAKKSNTNFEPGVATNWEDVWMLFNYDGGSVSPDGTYPNMTVGKATTSLYNLGAFDAYVDNGDGTVTVTRKTWKVDGGNYRYQANAQSGRGYYQYSETVSSENDIILESVQFTRVDSNGWWNASLDANTTYVSYDNASNQIVILPATGVTPNDYKVIYKTSTSYTETLPANVSLNTLDANMSDIVHDEVEKTLNLLNQTESPRVFEFQIDLGTVHLKPNTTYYLKGYGWTVNNSCIRVTTTDFNMNTNIEQYYSPAYDFSISNGGSFTTSSTLTEGDYGLVLRGTFTVGSVVVGTVMLNEGSHAYPYQPYNGAIVHEIRTPLYFSTDNVSPASIDQIGGNWTSLGSFMVGSNTIYAWKKA